MDVFADATYAGGDTGGRLFQSPEGEALELLDGVRGIYGGAYEDQFRGGDAELGVLMTPDKLFAVAFANWAPWGIVDGWTGTWVLQEVVEPAE